MIKIFFDRDICIACHACEFACSVEHSASKDPERAHLEKTEDTIPRRRIILKKGKLHSVCCQHCKKPACKEACPSDAFVKEDDDEVKLVVDKCTGQWKCIEACPFDAIQQGETHGIKCDMCPDRPEGDYACVEACPTGSLFAGTMEDFKKRSAEKKAKRENVTS